MDTRCHPCPQELSDWWGGIGRHKRTQTIRTQSERRFCCALTELASQEGSLEEEMCGLGLENVREV